MFNLGAPEWALVGTIIGAIIGITGPAINSRWLLKQQFEHDREMYVLKNKSVEEVKATLLDMLNHRSYTKRSFDSLKGRIGGYTDDELRRLLHEVSAKKSKGDDGTELWAIATQHIESVGTPL